MNDLYFKIMEEPPKKIDVGTAIFGLLILAYMAAFWYGVVYLIERYA